MESCGGQHPYGYGWRTHRVSFHSRGVRWTLLSFAFAQVVGTMRCTPFPSAIRRGSCRGFRPTISIPIHPPTRSPTDHPPHTLPPITHHPTPPHSTPSTPRPSFHGTASSRAMYSHGAHMPPHMLWITFRPAPPHHQFMSNPFPVRSAPFRFTQHRQNFMFDVDDYLQELL